MKDLKNIEIIDLKTEKGKLIALISYLDPGRELRCDNGYDTIEVPVNLRPIQYSVRGNMMVDQSVKNYEPQTSEK